MRRSPALFRLCLVLIAWWIGASAAYAAPAVKISFPGPDGITLTGWLYTPEGTGPHPAVVALHGCGGLLNKEGLPSSRHEDWGRRLSADGFVVLFPDSFTPRGLGSQCKVDQRLARAAHERTADALAALTYLAGRGDVKTSAVTLLGWSNGGSTVLSTVEPRHAPVTGPDFAKAVAFYPGCKGPSETGHWKTRMPLLILMGESDNWTPAAPCHAIADTAKAAGETVDIITYPGTYHDFDMPDMPLHQRSGLAYSAAGDGVAMAGTNPAARADAIRRVPPYLAR